MITTTQGSITNRVKINSITRIEDSHFSLPGFHNSYSGKPAIFSKFACSWPAYRKWSDHFFSERYGEDEVQVSFVDTYAGDVRDWNTTVTLKQFLENLNNEQDSTRPVYLSEWYAFQKHPELFQDFEGLLPPVFEDWMEVFPKGWVFNRDTRTNIRWGPAGTGTLVHFDNLAALSWLAVLRGKKRWVFFPAKDIPGWDAHPQSDEAKSLRLRLNQLDLQIRQALAKDPQNPQIRTDLVPEIWVGDMEPGDLIYIPSQWYHLVENLETTLSVGCYLVNEINFERSCQVIRLGGGRVGETVYRAFLGSRRRHAFWRSKIVRAVTEAWPGRATASVLKSLTSGNNNFWS